jgi:hypothetical protein
VTRVRALLRSELFMGIFLLAVVAGIAYLPFIMHFAYYNDDWYEIYSANVRGPLVFQDIYSIDRPLRLVVMGPAYALFGADPLYWDLSALFFRVLGALGFLWLLWRLWPRQRPVGILMALLFLLYPGFLSQPQGIDYQSQMVSLAAATFSMALLVRAVQSGSWMTKMALYLASSLLSWLYLGLVEYFIGFEVVKFACLVMLALRDESEWRRAGLQVLRNWLPAFFGTFLFLIWRVFFFHSERGATDIGRQLGGVGGSPFSTLANWGLHLAQDSVKVILLAWTTPFDQLVFPLSVIDALIAFLLGLLVVGLVWYGLRGLRRDPDNDPAVRDWRREALLLGLVAAVVCVLPVTLVNRQVVFPVLSRYALASSIGASMTWIAVLYFSPQELVRRVGSSLLILMAVMVQYGNGAQFAAETAVNQNFWWQVSWRIPQIDQGTTLIVNYPSGQGGEDYIAWGPATLIYYPQSQNSKYPQPGLYAELLIQDTVNKVISQRPNIDFTDRRSIRTYASYRNILILSQPQPDSCVQVIAGPQLELSSSEDPRVTLMAPYSQPQHIQLTGRFVTPPAIPFGREPAHGWCYYYEKAAYARQSGDWQTVSSLGAQALQHGLAPADSIEWMPFLEAYARLGDQSRLGHIAKPLAKNDPFVTAEACHILSGMQLDPATLSTVKSLFCQPN